MDVLKHAYVQYKTSIDKLQQFFTTQKSNFNWTVQDK